MRGRTKTMDNSGNNGWDNNQWNDQNQWDNGYQQGPQPVQRQPVFYNGILNRPLLKQESKEIFRANYGNSLAATILPSIIAGGISMIPIVGGFISWFFSPILFVGGYFLILELVRGYQQARAGDIFNVFDDFGNVFGAMFMTNLFIGLWSLLLVIPGIYKAFSWAMVQYILADNPKMSGTEARALSEQMMDGHKMEYFVLLLSFLGWELLGACTFGILDLFYVNPWLGVTIGDYYDNLRMLYEARQ